MNKTFISGNLGKDVEVKLKKDNVTSFAVFSLANTEKRGDNEITMWMNCYIQNEKMINSKLMDYLKKGTKVLIEGQLKADIWTKQDGTADISYAFNIQSLELIGGANDRPSNSIPESIENKPAVAHVQPTVVNNPTPVVSSQQNTVEHQSVISTADEDDLPF